MANSDWSKYIRIDRNWVTTQLNSQFEICSDKLMVRLYTIKPSGTQISIHGICECLHDMLPHFVYSDLDIEKIGQMKAGLTASKSFGLKDPKTDGKYGELLLFALVESVLQCKMVGHKLKSLSNFRDQVKGGDGIFIGNYKVDGVEFPCYLIGESKIEIELTTALKHALDSLSRFHENIQTNDFLGDELIVAKEFLKINPDDIDDLYDRLTPKHEKFKKQILIHPVLLMTNSGILSAHETNAKTVEQLEQLIKSTFEEKKELIMKTIMNRLEKYEKVKKVYCDFFIIPTTDVNAFRELMYHNIHGVPYQR